MSKLTQEELLDKLIEEGGKWPLHTIIAGIFWDEATPLLWQIKEQLQRKTVTRTEIENAVGDTSDEYTEGVIELFESKGFEVVEKPKEDK